MSDPAAPHSEPVADPLGEPAPQRQVAAPPDERWTPRSPFVVALCGWLVPGLGYWIQGLRKRGLTAGIAILLLFTLGVFIGGIRVIDVPGYRGAEQVVTPDGQWALTSRPVPTLLDKPWYLGQILAGPVTLAASYGSIEAAEAGYPKGTAHVAEFGTLFAAVAGMLNLLTIIDAAGRATQK